MSWNFFAIRDWGNLISGFGTTAIGIHYIGCTCFPAEYHVLGVTTTLQWYINIILYLLRSKVICQSGRKELCVLGLIWFCAFLMKTLWQCQSILNALCWSMSHTDYRPAGEAIFRPASFKNSTQPHQCKALPADIARVT